MTTEKVLLIDDEPDVIELCQRALEQEGFEVKGALNGEEGLRLFSEGDFDLILLDVKLPDRDGLDVLSTVQEMDPEMAVIIISGYGTMEMAIRALKLGAQDFLLKPFTPKQLVTSMQKVLERRRLIQENLRLKARLPILEISKALMAEVNLQRLVQLALETVQQTLGAGRVSLMLLDEERQELSISAALGLPDEVVTSTRVKVGQGLASLAVQRKEPILLPEQAEDDSSIQALMTRSDVGPAICMPLMLKDRVLGVLNVSRLLGAAPFRQDDVDLLSILGGQIAVAIENARLFEKTQQEIAERKRVEEALRKRTHDLDGRIKELQCLYGISRFVERQDRSLREIIQGIVDLIPSAWQYPEIACARAILEGDEFRTRNFKGTNWRQTSDIIVHGEQIGNLEIGYLEERPESDEGPFQKEERSLLNAIAKRLGEIIERVRIEETLRASEKQLRSVTATLSELTNALTFFRVDED
jgi:DNA-binding response OmpR family regulator